MYRCLVEEERLTQRQMLTETGRGQRCAQRQTEAFFTCVPLHSFIHMYVNYTCICVLIHPRIQQTFAETPCLSLPEFIDHEQ